MILGAEKEYILWFRQISKKDIPTVGGKGANLGEMTRAGFPVPSGFCISTDAYFTFLEETGLKKKIFALIKEINVENTQQLEEATANVRKIIKGKEIPLEMQTQILKAYSKMNETKIGWLESTEKTYVAVRSSATAEDLPQASFAGQQETFLNVIGDRKLLDAVKACWASLFTARATYYRKKQGFPTEKVGISVVIQRMVNSDAAGVMFTSTPTGDESKIVIEAAYGLGEVVVSGSVTPDTYTVDKAKFKLIEKKIAKQEWMIIRKAGGNQKLDVASAKKEAQKLSDDNIIALARIGKQIENHYKSPQDIEWALEGKELFIVQTRAITTLGLREKVQSKTIKGDQKAVASGLAASPGIITGVVRIIPSVEQITKAKQGEIIATTMTTPDWVPIMRKSSAIITDEGGSTCHAAIVSRELGIPCVVGTEKATKILEDNDLITVDGFDGFIYEGKVELEAPKNLEEQMPIIEKNEIEPFEKAIKKELKETAKQHGQKERPAAFEKEKKIFEIEEEEEKETAQEFREKIIEEERKEAEEIVKDFGKEEAEEMPAEKLEEEEEKIVELLEKVSVKVNVNVALPEAAASAAKTNADGVGLLRAEHMITAAGKHPAEYLREGKQEELTAAVKEGVKKVASLFRGKPVWYRTFDARTDEFRHLEGGDKEPEEDNPMIGWHGIRRDLDEPELLKAQFFAIKQLLMEGVDNLGIMLPFVQNVDEVKQAKKIAEECGLSPRNDVKFGVMVETPAACWIIDDLIEEGIDFVSFGTNDLTQLTLGLDRNNGKVQKWFSELHPAILKSVNHVIQACKQAHVHTGICGQAGSNPEMVRHLVHFGIDSVSANIDAVEKIRKVVLVEEKKMFMEK